MVIAWLLGCGSVSRPPTPDTDPSARWALLLRDAVTPSGLVDYEVLRADPQPLADFVGWIAEHGPETDRFRLLDDDRRLAWHLNAYNATVLWRVLAHWPLTSVQEVPSLLGPPGTGFFLRERHRIDREPVSLYWYERALILPTYEEPLAHAALNCASRSCPPLRGDLYRDATLNVQLKDQMRRWVAEGAVTLVGGSFEFNPIFEWYADDFRRWAGADTPCDVVRPYADEALLGALHAHPECPHTFAAYDWSLNAAGSSGEAR